MGREVLGLACQRASLKPVALGADTQRMFAARHRPLLLVEDRLLALRMSLNAPVLATAELPVGPARAAIVVHAQGAAQCFSIVVRSLRNGASVIYELEGEDLSEEDGWSVALDASLSFGESMGFLFDDEMLVDRRPETLRRAITRLHEILAPPEVSDVDLPGHSAPRAIRDEGSEILLEDELDNAAQDVDQHGSEATGPLHAPLPELGNQTLRPLPVARPVQLSKFRAAPPDRDGLGEFGAPGPLEDLGEMNDRPPTPTDPAARVPGGATLGRVRPVRLRALDPDAPGKVDPLLRLLADF